MNKMNPNQNPPPDKVKASCVRRGKNRVGKAHAVQNVTPSVSAPETVLNEYSQHQWTKLSSYPMASINASFSPPQVPGGWPGVAVRYEHHGHRASTPAPVPSKMPNPKKPKQTYSNNVTLQHIRAPTPTAGYLTYAYVTPTQLPSPQRLLLVLDLNGTLLYRPNFSSNYLPRPFLAPFLAYCLANHSVLIWSSATPPNVSAICGKLFRPNDRRNLLGEWARDTLGLTPEQYVSKVQVYKRLDRIWDDLHLSTTHPLAHQGQKWGQENTLLIDDSPMKASAQPYNLVRIPEFAKDNATDQGGGELGLLGQVVGYLEEARRWGNVSAFVRNRKFEVKEGWRWDWEPEKKGKTGRWREKEGVQQQPEVWTEGSMDSDTEERGGVRLERWMLEGEWG